MNLRMNELTGAVALAQIRKLDTILKSLREKKARLKTLLETALHDGLGKLPGIEYRKLNDIEGECATMLTLLFETKEKAEKFCDTLSAYCAVSCKPLSRSGWHVYNNMEQILNKVTGAKANCPFDCPRFSCRREYKKHMLPQTDSILDRAVNISIGVVDAGIGAAFGININSTDAEIESVAAKIREIAGMV